MLAPDSIDPVARSIAEFGLGLLFLNAGLHKLRHPAVFRETLAAYRILPGLLTGIAAPVVIALELVVGFAVFVPPAQGIAVAAMITLLAAYTLAISINLLRGRRDIDCGCLGPAMRQTLSGWLVVRNLVLAGLASLCFVPVAQRTLHWADIGTIAFGVTAFLLLYTASNHLAANQPKLKQLRADNNG